MYEYSLEQIKKFFEGIALWRSAYISAQLNYLAIKQDDKLMVLSARLYLTINQPLNLKPIFNSGNLQAGQLVLKEKQGSIEEVLNELLSDKGLFVEGHGHLSLARNEKGEISASSPIMLHQEGITIGNRLAVISISGAQSHGYLLQPETDWKLKASCLPYDNLNELTNDFGLGTLRGDFALIEVVATNAVQVYAKSTIEDKNVSIGLWMARSLDKSKAHIGYRVLDKGNVVIRDTISGSNLTWEDENEVVIGTCEFDVPVGSIVQCFACYEGDTHQVQWFADPAIFQNPRAVVLSIIDSTGQLLNGYLAPDLPPKGKVADDFEAAINWVLWGLGFASANFGLNAKTRDAFDSVAVSPNGDFVVVECTIGLLRAESKLSKLAQRVASLREVLDKSNMRQLRILPVIVTALTLEQVKADIAQAEETGILVLTREDLTSVTTELLRYPNADRLFERGIEQVDSKRKNKDLFGH